MIDEEEEHIIKKIISKFDKPFFPPSISTKSHLIFLKYTSPKYRSYIINQYKLLCNKLHNNVNKYEIFYLSLLFNDLILYNCENEPIITNISLLVFCCFYLSVKFRLNQYEIMSINSLKKFNPEKFKDYSNEEIQYVETLCLKLLNYKLNYTTSYDFLILLVYSYNLNKKIINNSMEELNKIITGDIKEYIFKSPLKIAYEALSYAKEKYNIKESINSDNINLNYSINSHHKSKNNSNNSRTLNNSTSRKGGTSSFYHKVSKYINSINDNDNNQNKNNLNKNNNNNNYFVNNNTISTNSSSTNKNTNNGGDSSHHLSNDAFSEIAIKKQIGKNNQESNKAIYIEPLYSISSSKINNQINNLADSKKRNNSVIMGLKYEIKACQTVNCNLNEEFDKEIIKKKEIRKTYKKENEQGASRYLINVNLSKKKQIKIQSLNDFSGVKLSLSNTKRNPYNPYSSFMRNNIKNMKSILQLSNHNSNK